MFPSSAENSGKCYSQQLFGPFASSESFMAQANGSDRYGTHESFGLGALNTEDADSVFDHSNGGYSNTRVSIWGADILSNWDRPFVMSSQRSRSPFSDSGRESQYSTSNLSDSSSLYSPSHSRPAPIGSRGRDTHPYVHRNYRGRGAVVPEAKGEDVGCSSQNPSICIERYYSKSAALVFRGTKRKMMEPVPPCKMSLERKFEPERSAEDDARRTMKNMEISTDKDIEKHFGSTYHKETLDYIRRQAKFDDKVISFLHDCMVHKFHKTVSTLHKLKFSCGRSKDEWAKIMEGVKEDDYMRRMEVVYCVACDIHIPVVFSSVQQHLHSLTHLKSKVAYKEQLKRDSVVTAKAIINNDNVKVRYEKYMKGEDPFAADPNDTSSDSQDPERSDEAEEDEENIDS
ncbi:DBIRD complex subunit ZNF326 [Labeo rohita]|uniref:DBIRD complex subunit ZNF326 n=1 Tax=Labeo rohita TaxID=84645 RepID=A0ABQ8MKZ4_LABRO|nr:DBIRD complex subunit ZNF326 [Labeo rohita]